MSTLQVTRKQSDGHVIVEVVQDAVYLGDGLYAWHDGYQLWLGASNGIEFHDCVALEPAVLNSFLTYVKKIQETQK